MFEDREDDIKEELSRVEQRAEGDITPSRQARKRCARNYKLRGIQTGIYKHNCGQHLQFICRV
jgi:hypothetical protein